MKLKTVSELLLALVIMFGVSSCFGSRERESSDMESSIHGSRMRPAAVSTPSEAVSRLLSGNERYCSGKSVFPGSDKNRRLETSEHQAPFAAIVGCSDSRVPVELIFDHGIGDLFVIRTAGNNVKGRMVMGSVDYAVKHLGVKLLLVLGHSSCGGVTAALANGDEDGAVNELVSAIRSDVSEYVGKMDCLDDAVRLNAMKQVEFILSHQHIRDEVENGNLLVLPAHYDIVSGKVEIFGTSCGER